MYNALVIFCLAGITGMFIWCIEATKSEMAKRLDAKSEQYRAHNRNTPKQQEQYRKEYWIRRNRNNLFESQVIVNGK